MSNQPVILTIYPETESAVADIRGGQLIRPSDTTQRELLYLIEQLCQEANLPAPRKVVWGEGDHHITVYPKGGGRVLELNLPRLYREMLKTHATLIKATAEISR
jgi:hypothetical protein